MRSKNQKFHDSLTVYPSNDPEFQGTYVEAIGSYTTNQITYFVIIVLIFDIHGDFSTQSYQRIACVQQQSISASQFDWWGPGLRDSVGPTG